MDLASLRAISTFPIRFFSCERVIIDAPGLSTLLHAKGSCAGALCGPLCPGRPAAALALGNTPSPGSGQQWGHGTKAPVGGFRCPRGALPKCQASPSGLKGMSQTTACPSGAQGDNIRGRKHPFQSQVTTRKKSHSSALVLLSVAVACSQAQGSRNQIFHRKMQMNCSLVLSSLGLAATAGPPPCGPPSAWALLLPWLLALQRLWGLNKAQVGTGALKDLSVPPWGRSYSTTPLWGWQ